MNRRTVLGLVGSALTMPAWLRASPPPVSPLLPAPAVIEGRVVRLQLRHTWTTVMSSSSFRDVVQVRIERDGVTGIGEGAPIARYHETALSALKAIESVGGLRARADLTRFVPLLAEIWKRLPGEWAAKAAISGAIADWMGQRLGVPMYRYFGLDPNATPVTTMSIGIDTPEMTMPRIADAVIVAFSVMWTYITVAEYVNAREGLGQLIQNARRFSAWDQVFAGIMVIIALALATYQLMVWLKRRLYPWETQL